MGWKLAMGVFLLGVTAFAADLKTIDKGAFSGVDKPLQVVVTNKTQWAELWQKHTANKLPKTPPPQVDFNKESVIFVTSGQKNTAGYSVEITDVRREKGQTEIVVSTKEPKPGALVAEALSAPFHIVELPRIEGEVKFKKG
jgi:hypothetical protein